MTFPAVPPSWGEPSTRTVTWYDPERSAAMGLELAGIDYLRAVLDGELPPPPISDLMKMEFVEVEEGRVVFTCEPDRSAYNPIGTVHGGLVCTLLDSVAGCAIHSTLPQGKGYTSVEIKVSYLRPVLASSGTLTATGTVIKTGSRVGFTEGVVTDAAGNLVATATSTLLVFDLPPGR
ncbi:PaaI family thioesterase [Antribacter sp. KLBMP9083]|uniref:PaaI family thioesterase n=1 Tax=Antribacter soli TaxID=2910976 RepID=A0AA41QFT4_9MICO|nr:PaaI family thioesterase [Antribacter soli]MCF4122674.1 PaaI family thioesterase [Antribacter soli]